MEVGTRALGCGIMWVSKGNAAMRLTSGVVSNQKDLVTMNDDTTNTPQMKRCSKCKKEKPLTCFGKNKSCIDGLQYQCGDCKRQAERDWYRNNRDKRVNSARIWAQNNRESRRKSSVQWYRRNREKVNNASRRWYHANADRAKLSSKKHRTDNPERYRVYNQARYSRKRSLPDTLTHSQWMACLEYFDFRCAVCGRPKGLWHTLAMDHWIPLSSPDCPGTVAANIVPLCHDTDGCNNSKQNKDAVVWLTERYGKTKAKEIVARIQTYFDSLKGKDNE